MPKSAARQHAERTAQAARDALRENRTPVKRLYPNQGTDNPTRLRQGAPRETLSPSVAQAIRKAAGTQATAVMAALQAAGLIGRPARGSQDQGVSPLGGQAI